MIALNVSTAIAVTITAASAQATNALKPNIRYMLIADTACWVAQGATLQVAAIGGAAGSMLVPANTPIPISGQCGAFLSVIGTAGKLNVIAGQE